MNKQAVVWVSTVLYILISLAVLGIVLAAVQPKIRAARDKAVIDQTINMLNDFDQKIIEVDHAAAGNIRLVNLQLRKGILTIDDARDIIQWQLEDSGYRYSEPGTEVGVGRIEALTMEVPKGFDVILTLNYSGDINLVSELTPLQPAKTPYKIFIKNNGSIGGLNQIIIYSG